MADKPKFLDQEGVAFLWDKVLELMSGVEDGKSAYEIAKELGFEGTEEEWIQSLEGSSGVYIGPDEPTEDINVWLDTAGAATELDAVPLVDTAGQTRYHLFVYEGQLALKEEGNDKPVYFLTGNDKQILEEQIKNNKTDLTGYATENYVDEAIASISTGGGSGFSLPLLYEITTTEEVRSIDTGDNAFEAKNIIIIEVHSKATATNDTDYGATCSIYTEKNTPIYPFSNHVLPIYGNVIASKYDKVSRVVGVRGDGGSWISWSASRNAVADGFADMKMKIPHLDSTALPIRGIIIGDGSASPGTRVFGVGTTLKIWGC